MSYLVSTPYKKCSIMDLQISWIFVKQWNWAVMNNPSMEITFKAKQTQG